MYLRKTHVVKVSEVSVEFFVIASGSIAVEAYSD